MTIKHWSSLGLLCVLYFTVAAQLSVASTFTDNAVLQRDQTVPIWGWTTSTDEVNVAFDGKTYTAQPDDNGYWITQLPPTSVGAPHTILITQAQEQIELSNILFGDVWVCSGQSNMEWTLDNSMNADLEKKNIDDTQIRHIKVQRTFSDLPSDTLVAGAWEVADTETIGNFTAVGYFFAKELRKEVGVPIGLLNTSWGGSRIEAWMSGESLGYEDVKSAAEINYNRRKKLAEKKRAELKSMLGELPEKDGGLQGENAYWAQNKYDDKLWKTMKLPTLWEGVGLEGLDGIVWFRKRIELSPKEARQGIVLHLGRIDDSDITWVNGQEVGRTEQKYNEARVYEVPPYVLSAGENIITVRVDDTGGGGGLYGLAEGNMHYTIKGEEEQKMLESEWKYKVGQAYVETLGNSSPHHTPMLLYNKMIHPILNFPIKGVIWYQGESNTGEARQYKDLFADMIVDWRERWQVGEFPFLWVQLANFMQADDQPKESGWAMLRESQSATLQLPNTAQAVIIDIGEADDIHPRNKHDVGYRLALGARRVAYGESNLVASGPVYKSMKRKGKKIVLTFEEVGEGLMAKNGELQEFAIAGADKQFVWAKAEIKGKNQVVVWSESIKKPVAVRYAWGNNPDEANLYNVKHLPASPFRTDDW
ncbi:MAG: sialate O-acetylesterase [Bacteroidota bacterium]